MGHILERRLIAESSHPTDDSLSFVTEVTVVPERLPLMYITDMKFDERDSLSNLNHCDPDMTAIQLTMPASASLSATLVCVRAPGLIMIAST